MDGHDEPYSLFMTVEMRLKTINQMWSQLPSEATTALKPKYFPMCLESPRLEHKTHADSKEKSTIPDRKTIGE